MKDRSLRALDALNFFNAGIQTGLGPFIAIFYGEARHWSPATIGVLLALQSFAGIAIQPFIGNLFDETRHKRSLTAAAAVAVAAGAIAIAISSSIAVQVVAQLVIGVAVTVFPAATASLALGLTEGKGLPRRLARNEAFTHGGNAVFAIVAGAVGAGSEMGSIFYTASAFALGMGGAVYFVRDGDVSHEAARAGAEAGEGRRPERARLRDVFRDRRVLVFTAAIVLFYAANAATLPLVGQIFAGAGGSGGHAAGGHGPHAAIPTALAVLVAEAVMVAVAALIGKKADEWGRKAPFVIAFGVLALRDGLGVVSHAPAYLIALQALDGAAAAIYGVLLKLVTSDLARKTGRFNVLQGTVQSAMALGGFLSNLAFGLVAQTLGFDVAFLGLAGVAVAGGVLYGTRMPETRPAD